MAVIFKDKCDNCHQMKICKGYKGKVLCEECISKEEAELIQEEAKPKEVVYEQTRLNFET